MSTRNLVAEFSCSIYKTGETTDYGYKNGQYVALSTGDFKQYEVVAGSVFKEEYNETLDSASVVLSHVFVKDRLIKIEPYQYVRIFDTESWNSTTSKYEFDKLYLVDNFSEKETNIKEHIFSYTINVMSETKWLEKIQLPNTSITHKVNADGSISKLSIYECIRRYITLYSPKIKMHNSTTNKWEYKPLIKIPEAFIADNANLQSDADKNYIEFYGQNAFYVKYKGNYKWSPLKSLTFSETTGTVPSGINGYSYYTEDGNQWHAMNWPAGTANVYPNRSIVYGSDRFVCVGSRGKTYYSTDGENWVLVDLNNQNVNLNSVTYGSNKYVCVGDNGVSYYSSDGSSWSSALGLDNTKKFVSVTYGRYEGSNAFVCISEDGAVYVSSDGTSWTVSTKIGLRTDIVYTGISFGINRLVCVGSHGCAYYLTANDASWNLMSGLNNAYCNCIYFDNTNSLFLCAGKSGKLFKSTDGENWVYISGLNSRVEYKSIAYGVLGTGSETENRYICVGANGSSYYSDDTITWLPSSGLSDISICNSIAFGNGRFICAGQLEPTRYFTVTNNTGHTITIPSGYSFIVDEVENPTAVSKTIANNSSERLLTLTNISGYIYGKSTIELKDDYNLIEAVGEDIIIETDFYKKFNVPSADLSFSCPTLRQLITTLMIQIGCIPTVHNRSLGYLDFNSNFSDFAINGDYSVGNTVNYIQKSLSSDSYANTLITMPENALNTENKVVCEKLGFRDTNNVILKQLSNLYLETKFPIREIKKVTMDVFGASTYRSLNSPFSKSMFDDPFADALGALENVSGDITVDLIDRINKTITISIVAKKFLSFSFSGHIRLIKSIPSEYRYDFAEEISFSITPSGTFAERTGTATISYTTDIDFTNYEIYGLITARSRNTITTASVDSKDYASHFFKSNLISGVLGNVLNLRIDITDLVKETSVRNQLETDYLKMEEQAEENPSIEELQKWRMCTLGYTIGDNKIYGFSEVYSVTDRSIWGPITVEKPLVELLSEWIVKKNNTKEKIAERFSSPLINNKNRRIAPVGSSGGTILTDYYYNFSDTTGVFGEKDAKLTSLVFNVEYQPLNSFNMSYSKSNRNIDIPISQFDSQESGMVDFDRFSVSEQEKVDRIGNCILSISQRITPNQLSAGYLRGGINSFTPVIFKDNEDRSGSVEPTEYTIFRRTFTVGNYSHDISYTGSENAILKNYFTSIRTKYRAYQYVDYSQSVERKENDTVYVLIGEQNNKFDGDNKIKFPLGNKQLVNVINGFENHDSEYNIDLNYEVEIGNAYFKTQDTNEFVYKYNEIVKNDLSIITNKNSFSLLYSWGDNIGAGVYISNFTYDTMWKASDPNLTVAERQKFNYSGRIGGVPQSWQQWDSNTYNEKHVVGFANELGLIANEVYSDTISAKALLKQNAMLPIVNAGSDTAADPSFQYMLLNIVDDNKSGSLYKTFYKDYAERINHTVQFVYYTNSSNIAWTELFIKNCSLVRNSPVVPNSIYSATSLDLNSEEHWAPEGTHLDDDGQYQFSTYISVHDGTDNNNSNPYIEVTWRGQDYIKVCHKEPSIVDPDDPTKHIAKVRDFIVFKRPSGSPVSTKFYVSLNDTKTEYVMSESSTGILYRSHRVNLNSSERTDTYLYPNND